MERSILLKYGITFSEEEYKAEGSGIPTKKNARKLVKKYSLPTTPESLDDLKEESTREYFKNKTLPLMPFVLDTLHFFKKQGFILGIVSGSSRYGVESTVKSNNLSEFFDILATGEDVEKNKPSPDVYLYALRQLGLEAEQCLAIEDTDNGIRSATSAGLACCAVRNEYSKEHDFSLANQEVNNLDQVKNWIVSNFL